MSKDISIHSWPCSYYVSNGKGWVCGTLSLTPTSLRFTSSKDGENLASFRLFRISEIKKESSSFIFSSLTVTEGNVKHWFSSLQPSRAVVFNVLEHFWREQLLGSGAAAGVETSESQTSKGKELIRLVSGSQKRLEDTGKVLHHQGEQFDNIVVGLNKIKSDSDVADKLLSELESPSWWPFGKLPWRSQQEVKIQHEASASASAKKGPGKEGVITEVPVIFSKGEDSNLKPGKLTVLVSALEISDSSSQHVHRYQRVEVDDIRVLTPFELSIRQRFIGKPDISYRLMSAKMPEVLFILEMQYKKKIKFMPDYSAFKSTPEQSPSDPETSIWNSASGFIDCIRLSEAQPGEQQAQLQVQVLQPPVSDSEAQELKQMVMKLKNLALEAETELERQDEALDIITSSVEHATTQIDKHTRRMRKLL
ncbi:SNP47 protein, partial [Polyodon spathula]|nr:synaptosomal-associated protein 47 [Polyodon spathula]XP_041100591.1 synaptosomal-associated protein 47 [Polyodon spathula]MBN3282388.1 SNP47 protein [Polyodon spathula]